MAITISQFTGVTGTGTSLNVSKTCTAGSAIVVVGTTIEPGGALTCTGYTQREASSHPSSGIKTFIWTADNIAGGSTSITMGGLAGYPGALQAFEILGVDAAAYEDSDVNTQSVTSTFCAGAGGVNISANGLALALLVADRDIVGWSVSGYTSGTDLNNASAIYCYARNKIFTGGATGERASGTLTSNGHTTCFLVALKAGAPVPTLTGTITLDDFVLSGAFATGALSQLSGGITLDDFVLSGFMGLAPGRIDTAPFKNWSGTLLPGATIPKLVFLKLSDMSTVLTLTNQTTAGDGVLTITNAALVTGTSYVVVAANADGSALGAEIYTAT